MKLILSILLAQVLFVFTSQADTPTERTKAYYEVFNSGEYERAAKFFDPDALKSFREMLGFLNTLDDETAAQLAETFFGEGETKESVTAMSDEEFFSSFLNFMIEQTEEAGGIKFEGVEVLGEVPEGEDVVHVLTRNVVSVGELRMESMEVISMKKIDDTWMVLLSGEMKGIATQLQQSFKQ